MKTDKRLLVLSVSAVNQYRDAIKIESAADAVRFAYCEGWAAAVAWILEDFPVCFGSAESNPKCSACDLEELCSLEVVVQDGTVEKAVEKLRGDKGVP